MQYAKADEQTEYSILGEGETLTETLEVVVVGGERERTEDRMSLRWRERESLSGLIRSVAMW